MAKSSDHEHCFCAFCKSPRRIYKQKRVGVLNIFASALGATIFMYLIFREFDPRVLLMFVVFLAISEVFVQLRWRIAMTCKHCGFDPVLYLKDVDAAVAKVQKRLEERKNDPSAMLAAPLKIPYRVKTKDLKAEFKSEAISKAVATSNGKKGRLVSRQI